MDAGVLIAGESGQIEAPSTVYLIEGPETILVDTSFGDPERMTESHPGFECHRSRGQQLDYALNTQGTLPLISILWSYTPRLGPLLQSRLL